MTGWFPIGTNGNEDGWRLDIVSLLAVIGESSMESHSQALTSSWTCMLPRLIPAPQALLKPTRPSRLPQVNSAVVGVHNGTLATSFNYFPNIIHPIDDLADLQFKMLRITHAKEQPKCPAPSPTEDHAKEKSGSTSIDFREMESGQASVPHRRSTFRKVTRTFTGDSDRPPPRVPTPNSSPLNVLAVASCLLTLGLFITSVLIKDGTACLALGTISLASSIVGYASWWYPSLTERNFHFKVPPGDIVMRTRGGAFLLVKCNENVARELYVGVDECKYHVSTRAYRILVGIGTFLLMISVVLLGNCEFAMQAAIGASYIFLNGAYWATSLIPKKKFWDLSNYIVEDITPEDAKEADKKQHGETPEANKSFTRTMWYTIRETKKIGWVKKSGAAPTTPQWDKWLKLAEENANSGNRKWNAVEMKEKIVGQSDSEEQNEVSDKDIAEQHAPALEVLPPDVI